MLQVASRKNIGSFKKKMSLLSSDGLLADCSGTSNDGDECEQPPG